MTVVVVTPFFHAADPARHDIMRRIFRHYARMPVTLIGVGSEGTTSEGLFTEHHPADQYREYPQDWPAPGSGGSVGLRAKFNAAVEAARDYDPDYVFLTGSDDLIPAEFFIPSDADLVGLAQGERSGAYFWEHNTDNAFWWSGESAAPRGTEFVGSGLGFSPRLLDQMGWAPFQFELDEIGVETHVRALGLPIEARHGMPPWQPKSTTALNTFSAVRDAHPHKPVPRDTFAAFRDYWEGLDDYALRVH